MGELGQGQDTYSKGMFILNLICFNCETSVACYFSCGVALYGGGV